MRQTENVLYQQSKAMFYLIFACIRLLLLAVCTIFFIAQFCSKIQMKRRQAILTDIWNGKGNRKQCKLLDIGKEGTMSDQNKIVPLLPEILVSGMPKEFKVVDVPKDGNCLFTIRERFSQDCFQHVADIENVLIRAAGGLQIANELMQIFSFYADDFDFDMLEAQLKIFRNLFLSSAPATLADIVTALKSTEGVNLLLFEHSQGLWHNTLFLLCYRPSG